MRRSLATPPIGRQHDGLSRTRALLASSVLFAASACRDPRATEAPTAPREAPPTVAPNAAPHEVSPRRDAAATTPHAPDASARADVGVSPTAHAPTAAHPRGGHFLGLDDDAIIARICEAPFERMERNRGGSTVSFRVRLEGGQKALFKPQQQASVANFRAELAAYRMSRLLGLDRVPPACGRAIAREVLQRAADGSGDNAFSQRVMTELLGRNGLVPGAVLFWVPGQLEPVPGVERYAALLDLAQPLAPEDTALAADLSALLVFDFLNDNVDRWSGGNILRQRPASGDAPGPMLFMDNGASFSAINQGLGARPEEQSRRLQAMGRFSRSLVAKVRALTAEEIRRAMADDPLGACLSDAQIAAVLTRRDRLVARVDEAIRGASEAEVLVFP